MDGTEELHFSELKQVQNIKGCMFSFIYYIHIYIYNERENKIVLVRLSEGNMEYGRHRENVRE
jgi:hypothetical protein